jgi:hypothetical protein
MTNLSDVAHVDGSASLNVRSEKQMTKKDTISWVQKALSRSDP